MEKRDTIEYIFKQDKILYTENETEVDRKDER